jgi:uncharacterized protein (DUF983 family)
MRFGRVSRSFGMEVFDDTDRLAQVFCPACGASRTLEYREYMMHLRDPHPRCLACGVEYRLYGGASARGGTAPPPEDPPGSRTIGSA